MKITHTEDYQKLRKESYPDIGDQLDALWKAIKVINNNGVALPAEAIKTLDDIDKVKKKFYKPKGRRQK